MSRTAAEAPTRPASHQTCHLPARQTLGHATHVLDRFHVVRWFSQGLTLVRRELQRREPHGVKPVFDPDVFRARFLLLQRADGLTADDQARLEQLFAKQALRI